ncbi:MAG: glycosyltransferase family 29 protein [Nitrosopumilus sp.]
MTDLFNDQLAIVASGRSLLHNQCGKAIDQFPMVLRFNRATVKGYEKDVGRFYTHWCTTFLSQNYPSIKGYPIQETICCNRPLNAVCRFDYKKLPTDFVLYIPPQILIELKNKYLETFYKPSTGLRLLWWIYKETGAKISKSRLFGFDCFGVLNKTKDHRVLDVVRSRKYYNQGEPSPRHWPQKERAILNEITT